MRTSDAGMFTKLPTLKLPYGAIMEDFKVHKLEGDPTAHTFSAFLHGSDGHFYYASGNWFEKRWDEGTAWFIYDWREENENYVWVRCWRPTEHGVEWQDFYEEGYDAPFS